MLTIEKVKQLQKDMESEADPPFYWKSMAHELLDSYLAALLVVEAAKKITSEAAFQAHCMELLEALKPFQTEES